VKLRGEGLSYYLNNSQSVVYENVCAITGLPTKRISAIYHSEKHLSEFYPQDGGESQLASE